MKTLRWLPRIFAALGAVLLVIGGYVYTREQAFIMQAAHATGTVVRLEQGRSSSSSGSVWYPVVSFRTASGESVEFRSNVGSQPPSWKVGETADVLYDPAVPQSAKIAGFFALHVGSFVLVLLGLVFGLIGGLWLMFAKRRAALEAAVRATGQAIQAKVTDIEYRTNLTVNNRHPYRIVAQAMVPGSNEMMVFTSANIWFDPRDHVGETVTVFVDRNDPKRYVVDLDFLPKVTA